MSRSAYLALVAIWASMSAIPAGAQLRRSTSSVELPPVAIATTDSPLAVDVNPATLPYLPSWGIYYVHAEPTEPGRAGAGDLVYGGDAVYLATPLIFGAAAGLGVQHIRWPGTGIDDRGAVSLALGFAPAASLSTGATVRWYTSSDALVDGVTTLDFSVAWRPEDFIAFSLLGRDLGAPIGFGGPNARANVLLAATWRPFRNDALALDAAAGIDEDRRYGFRLAADLRVPAVGRLLVSADMTGRGAETVSQVTLGAGLAVDWDHYGIGGGLLVPELGDPGWYATARMDGARRGGIPTSDWVLDVEVRGGVGERRMISLVQQLDRALHDDEVHGVFLRLRGAELGMAYAQEVRWMIERLEAAGKRVVCHFDSAVGSEWYACGPARARLVDPAGDIRLMGPAIEVMHFGELAQTLGVRVEFIRIGEYKSYPEEFTNRESSAPATRQRDALLDDVFARLLQDSARDLEIDRAAMQRIVDEGPYFAPEALDARIVDGYADEWAIEARLADLYDGSYARLESPPDRAPRRWPVTPRLGMVVVDGSIVEGNNVDVPFVGIHMTGARSVVRAIDALAADPGVRAIVLRVDSGGGSALASDQIWRAVMRARLRKPVVASMGASAASGGYYVASAAHEIWANPSTVTGSIGIFFGKADVLPLAESIGVNIEQMRRGRHAGAESLYRPFTAEERALLAEKVRLGYRMFLNRIHQARGTEVAAIDRVGRGRIWSGDAARRNGLVDHLGGLGAAMDRARELGNLPDDCDVVVVPRAPSTLLDYVLAPPDAASGERVQIPLTPELRQSIRVLLTMDRTGSGAMAMMPELVQGL